MQFVLSVYMFSFYEKTPKVFKECILISHYICVFHYSYNFKWFIIFLRYSNNFWLVDGTCSQWYNWTTWFRTYHGPSGQARSVKGWFRFYKRQPWFTKDLHWIQWPVEVIRWSLWSWQASACLNMSEHDFVICTSNAHIYLQHKRTWNTTNLKNVLINTQLDAPTWSSKNTPLFNSFKATYIL